MRQDPLFLGLVALLVVSVVAGAYLYMGSQAKLATLNAELQASQAETANLQTQKTSLQQKMAKGLVYTEFLDILFWGAWVEMGFTSRFEIEDEADYLLELERRTDTLGDTQLDNYFSDIKTTGSDMSVMETVNYLLGQIEKSLK